MERVKQKKERKRVSIPLVWQWVILGIGTAWILFDVMAISLFTSPSFVYFGLRHPLLLLLNYLPIVALELLIFFATCKATQAVAITDAVFGLLAFINAEKIRILQDPLVPGDVVLIKELVGISEGFTPGTLMLYAGIVIVVAMVIFCSSHFFAPVRINWRARVIGAVAVFVAGAIVGQTVYAKSGIYDLFPVEGNIYFQVNQYDSKGVIYSFCHNFYTMKVRAPEDYDKNEVEAWDEAETMAAPEYQPNIIFIMGESFSDLSENEHLDFSDYRDPLKNWKELAQSDQAVSGHIMVPGYGGGTSDTEFDVLTGLSTRFIDGASNSYSLIRKKMDAIPWRLKEMGYDTLAIHPGFSWFYNRANVYPDLGFDEFLHLEHFQGEEKYRGGYIADLYAIDCILEEGKTHDAQSDNPLFTFCVTIENHGPYDEKYNEVEETFSTDVDLTAEEKNLLNSYFMGIIDAVEEQGRLTEELEKSDEPTIVVYFGDHLPGFSNGMAFFDLLDYDISASGSLEEMAGIYKTPYLIWQNSAAQQQKDIKDAAQEIGLTDGSFISSSFLGAAVMEMIGFDQLAPVLTYDNEVRRSLPVVSEEICMDAEGNYLEEENLDETQKEMIQKLRYWTYYKMFDE